ncbi:maleylpyruvate isomerase family mycothiol-dependent enzyme [Streptomyces sp. SID11385]|uniref:maleylpyruvate isomerase family mycothiol-dependent enzyme n=1 Tax=Streptomyces sp. SID11385 TaxID=2706031 RepID=UPI0013C8773F|nr:maleylpyruvate isomerase family mycothiol-dependent enzyme [Streptomyces sp. SID11385]NEA39600.1 maleylpyruvate isomerase family mycothiol-dependent enzyme [Streptomyces sp. SID11385]
MDHLKALRHELDAFDSALDGDLSARVAHCGDWSLADLAVHRGAGNLWVVTAVRKRHGRGYDEGAAPRERDALREWHARSARDLVAALSADPATEAWTFSPPRTVAFWLRRRAQETLMHRWDAEHARGATSPMDPALAADGVAEVFDTMAPRMVSRGAAVPPARAVRLTATDTGDAWVHGPGEPVAEVAGPAEGLLLMLWGRKPRDHASLTWAGDRAAGAEALSGPLVP